MSNSSSLKIAQYLQGDFHGEKNIDHFGNIILTLEGFGLTIANLQRKTGSAGEGVIFSIQNEKDNYLLNYFLFELCKLNSHIPIYNPDHSLVFTTEDFDQLRREYGYGLEKLHPSIIKKLHQILDNEDISYEELSDIVSQIPLLAERRNQSVGIDSVRHANLGLHTHKVLQRLYSSINSESTLGNILSHEERTVALLIHDLGKTDAVAKLGNKDMQHKITIVVATNLLKILGYTEQRIKLIIAIINQDIFGSYLQNDEIGIQKPVNQIITTSKELGVSAEEYLDQIVFYWICDASSYEPVRKKDYLFLCDEKERFLGLGISSSQAYYDIKKTIKITTNMN